jgi:FdhE protein
MRLNAIEKQQHLLVKTIKQLRQKNHIPKDLITLLGETAALQLDSARDISINLPDLAPCTPGKAESAVKTVLSPETLPLDRKHIAVFFSQLIQKITDQKTVDQENLLPPPMVEAVTLIGTAFNNNEIDLDGCIDECLQGSGPIMDLWAAKTPKAPAALSFLVRASIEPSLTAAVTALAEWLKGQQSSPEQEIRQTGSCPVCGSLPHMLELRGKEGFRFAFCSLCRHEYRIRRLACPVCDNTDTDKLKFFTVPEEPGFRVEACDSCKSYIKTIDFRTFDRKSFPALNDLESLALDFIAQDQGYSRATLSVWGM